MNDQNTSCNSSNVILYEPLTLQSFIMACVCEGWHQSNVSMVDTSYSQLFQLQSTFPDLQPNIHFNVLYAHPSLIMCGHTMERVSFIAANVRDFGSVALQPTIYPAPPTKSRPPRRWGSSAHPCWYSCLFSGLKPAAATAGKTEALSGSVGQKCWETDICLATVSSDGATKGHLRLPLDWDTP